MTGDLRLGLDSSVQQLETLLESMQFPDKSDKDMTRRLLPLKHVLLSWDSPGLVACACERISQSILCVSEKHTILS